MEKSRSILITVEMSKSNLAKYKRNCSQISFSLFTIFIVPILSNLTYRLNIVLSGC